jgi:DNA repair protein RadC
MSQGRQVSFLAPEEAEKEAARNEILKIIKENLSLARDIAALYGHPRVEEKRKIKSPADAAGLLSFEMGSLDQEQMRVVVLSTRNDVLSIQMVYQGSLNTTLVRMAELFKEAIRRNGAAIILAHNHPSGVLEPSPEDLHLTKQAIAAGELLSIEVLDHLVIGRGGKYRSLRESCGEMWE